MISKTPKPPYYAVIFSSIKKSEEKEYDKMSEKLEILAQKADGFLGMEHARNELGITVSYWKDGISILKWKKQASHQRAQRKGHELWYSNFKVRVAKVERDYEFFQ